jgi:hypothetical protein
MLTQDAVIYAVVGGLFLYLIRLLWRPLSPGTAPRFEPDKHIVVDGSNVMYWSGTPSVLVLARVLAALNDRGLIPIVYFDANVGHKLWGEYANANAVALKMRINPRLVVVVPKGVTADEMLLETAVDYGLRVVTNDRFLDWRLRFPQAAEKGFLIKGEWRQGSVMFRGL